jgi:hypothetical protein
MHGLSVRGSPSTAGMTGFGSGRSRLRDWIRAAWRWVIEHRLVLAVGLIAAVPVLVSTVRALLAGWTPVSDDAVMATHSFDVLSAHSRLVGAYSDASSASGGLVFDPGPMLFWLLAFQARFLGDWALPVTMGVVNTASIVGVVALARRRGGRAFMFATAAALVVMCRSLPQAQLHELNNSLAGVVVFTLLLFLAWSVACGEYRLLPLTVVVASFVAQVHFSLVLAGLAVFLVALAGFAWSVAGSGGSGAVAAGEHRRRWLVGSLVVGLVCWSAPLLDQALHSPGNFVRIVQTATAREQTAGLTVGWHELGRATGVWPRWLRGYSPGVEVRDLLSAPNGVAVASSVLIVGGLLIVALLGLRRRRRDVVTGASLALALNGAVLAATTSIPTSLIFRDYALRWTSPAGMFSWLVLGWSLVVLRPTSWSAARAPRILAAVRRPASASLIGLTITAMLAVGVATGPQSDTLRWAYEPARTTTALVSARLPRQHAVLVAAGSSITGYVFQQAIIYRLRRQGYRVVAPKGDTQRLGAYYSPDGPTGPRYDDVLLVDVSNKRVPRGGHVIAHVPLHGAPGEFGAGAQPPPTALTIWVLPAPTGQVAAACPPAVRASTPGPTTHQLRIVPEGWSARADAYQILGHFQTPRRPARGAPAWPPACAASRASRRAT